MTGYNLIDTSLALMMTNRMQSSEYVEYALPLINLVLAETFECNNSIRISNGKSEICEIYSIDSLEEPLPCEEELCRVALAVGLCAKLLMDDDDMAKVAFYQNQYVSAVEQCSKWIVSKVADYYSGGESL